MGSTVLDAGTSPVPAVHLYAHCLRDQRGGVALLAINTDRDAAHDLVTPIAAGRYTLTAKDLMETSVDLNGTPLKLGVHDALPEMKGKPALAGAGDAGAGEYYVPGFPERGQCELPVIKQGAVRVYRCQPLPYGRGSDWGRKRRRRRKIKMAADERRSTPISKYGAGARGRGRRSACLHGTDTTRRKPGRYR